MRLLGHPLHPMLVHFPIVFWTCAIAADVGGLITQSLVAAQLAAGSLVLGCASGLLAMIAGVIDFSRLPPDSPARDSAIAHFMAMCVAWLIFLVALALHGYPPTPTSMGAVLTTAAGFCTMAYGGWLGGKLVFEYGVGRTPAK